MLLRLSPILVVAVIAVAIWRIASPGGSAVGGNYVGTTSQGLPITFTASSSSVDNITFTWQALCADRQRHTNSISIGGASINGGAFSASGILNTGGQATVTGQVSGTSASGQLSRSGPTAFGTNCTDNGVTWTAHRLG